MNSKITTLVFLIMTVFSFLSCGADRSNEILLSGKLNISAESRSAGSNSTTFVVVSRTMDFDEIQNDPLNNILELAEVPSDPYEFSIDLSKANVAEGDKVYIFAFTTERYVSGVPSISTGDFVGFYLNRDTFDLAYTISNGNNSNIEIDVTREVFDFDTSVSGTVTSDTPGNIILVAYAGSINSFSFDDIDINAVIGYKKIERTGNTTPYSMNILPYGFNIPIEGVYVFAFLDINGNGKPDTGDKWGIYSDEDGYPSGITVTDIPSTNINLTLDNEVSSSTGYENSITGSFEAPAGYGPGSTPVFMVVCKADDPEELFSNTVETVKYFEKLPAGQTTFDLDLSNTGLAAGDKVMIIAMWDREFTSDFPRLKEGNMIGYYLNETDFTYQYVLNEGTNPPIRIKLNKTYKKNSATVNGNLLGTDSGDVIVIAYTGEFNSLDTAIDTDKIAGYNKITKGTGPIPYSMELLPFNNFPMEKVFIFAILDKNRNGIPDTGDRLGYYSAPAQEGVPTVVTLNDAANGVYNIKFRMDYIKPVEAGTSLILRGNFTAPAGYTSDPSSKPVFIMVAKSDNTADIFDNPMSAMKYFTKLPQGATSFDIELSGTGLVPGDSVMVIALWDRDYAAGFPSPSDGDMVGYYINNTDYTCQYVLLEGTNPPITLAIDKVYKENYASVKGTILGNESGDVIIVAYTGEFDSMNTPIDTNKIIGYKKITKGAEPKSYVMEILPTVSLPVQNVFIFAILDKNANGKPDNGDRLGFYSSGQSGIPTLVTLYNAVSSGKDISFTSDFSAPVSGAESIVLNGLFTAPSGYTSDASTKPVFIMIAKADSTVDIASDSLSSSLKYFKKLDQGATSFSLELSDSGLVPGDKVMIIAMWDRDYVAGFPGPSNGDVLGYYLDQVEYTNQYTLAAGANGPVTINLNKTYSVNSATVSGNILGTESGEIILVAYNGEFNSLDAKLDTEKIIGYTNITKGAEPISYSMNILPITTFPVNVFLFAILDKNANGVPDTGDRLGFHATSEGVPAVVTLYNSTNSGKNIEFVMDYVDPSTAGGTQMSLSGSISIPSGYTSDKPIYLLIAKADNTFEIISDPMNTMKYFTKLTNLTAGQNKSYNINLTGLGLVPGDEIRILALWDKDWTAGFPNPTNNDKIGYYQNKTNFDFSIKLAAGANYANLTSGWSFGIDKTLYDHNGQFTFGFGQSNTGLPCLSDYRDLPSSQIIGRDLIVVMVHEDGVNVSDNYSITDMNYVIAIDYINAIPNLTNSHTLRMFPFIYDGIAKKSTNPISVGGVYVYVILDSDQDGVPDAGEHVGYYWTWIDLWPHVLPRIPMKVSAIYYDRVNSLGGEIMSILNMTY